MKAALDPKYYPFFHKVQRNLYIMEELLDFESSERDISIGKKDDAQDTSVKRDGGLFFSDSFACSKSMKWSFKNNPNAEAFRRSMLPFYLLNDDSGWKHPRYVELSNLS